MITLEEVLNIVRPKVCHDSNATIQDVTVICADATRLLNQAAVFTAVEKVRVIVPKYSDNQIPLKFMTLYKKYYKS